MKKNIIQMLSILLFFSFPLPGGADSFKPAQTKGQMMIQELTNIQGSFNEKWENIKNATDPKIIKDAEVLLKQDTDKILGLEKELEKLYKKGDILADDINQVRAEIEKKAFIYDHYQKLKKNYDFNKDLTQMELNKVQEDKFVEMLKTAGELELEKSKLEAQKAELMFGKKKDNLIVTDRAQLNIIETNLQKINQQILDFKPILHDSIPKHIYHPSTLEKLNIQIEDTINQIKQVKNIEYYSPKKNNVFSRSQNNVQLKQRLKTANTARKNYKETFRTTPSSSPSSSMFADLALSPTNMIILDGEMALFSLVAGPILSAALATVYYPSKYIYRGAKWGINKLRFR